MATELLVRKRTLTAIPPFPVLENIIWFGELKWHNKNNTTWIFFHMMYFTIEYFRHLMLSSAIIQHTLLIRVLWLLNLKSQRNWYMTTLTTTKSQSFNTVFLYLKREKRTKPVFTCVFAICNDQDKLTKLINFNSKSKLERYSSTHNDTSLMKERVFFYCEVTAII